MRRWMDAMGVDIACMFPTPMLNLAACPRVEVEVGIAAQAVSGAAERMERNAMQVCEVIDATRNKAAAVAAAPGSHSRPHLESAGALAGGFGPGLVAAS